MRILGGAIGLLLISTTFSAYAQKPDYNWFGQHACIVEEARGVVAFPETGSNANFLWTGFVKSLLVEIRVCKKDMGLDWEDECQGAEFGQFFPEQALKISAAQRVSAKWRYRGLDIMPFASYGGEAFQTDAMGRFIFTKISETSDELPAAFVAAGTCTPFKQ